MTKNDKVHKIVASGIRSGYFGLVVFFIFAVLIIVRGTFKEGIQLAPGWVARGIVIAVGVYCVFFNYGAALSFGRCYRAKRRLATLIAGFLPLFLLTVVALAQGQSFTDFFIGLVLPASILGFLLVGITLWGEGEGYTYEACPNCGEKEKEIVIFKCKSCGLLHCKHCGKYDPRRGGYCPSCNSCNKLQIMGSIGG